MHDGITHLTFFRSHSGSYHGRTNATASMTRSKTVYSEGVSPFMPGVFTTDFPYYAHMFKPVSTPTDELVDFCLKRLELMLKQETSPRDTAAIILEPVLGEGGYVPAPSAYLHGLRSVCDKHGIMLVADEVQSGFGRTGKMFAVEHSGVRPDMMTFAKGLANGYPLSGLVASKAVMDVMPPGSMGGTYAGNAVACAASRATIETFRRERVLENVAARSEQLMKALTNMRQQPFGHVIEDIRGLGLMIGVQFQSNSSEPIAPRLSQACLKRGMLLMSTSSFDVIRWIPPRTVSEEELAQGVEIFPASLEEVVSQQS